MIIELQYGRTNTYLIKGSDGYILFDTGWAGELDLFYKAIGKAGVRIEEIKYLLISHFHPDHMGLVGQLSELGVSIVIADLQKEYVHSSDHIFSKENNVDFVSIDDNSLTMISILQSRKFLKDLGIEGELIHTPGHSDDSISLLLDEGIVLVGDLNPLYELELHKGTIIGESWDNIFERAKEICISDVLIVYYGHARSADITITLSEDKTGIAKNSHVLSGVSTSPSKNPATNDLVSCIMKMLDKGYPIDKIMRKTGADKEFINDVTRMYVTHPGITVQGILDRIEIKDR